MTLHIRDFAGEYQELPDNDYHIKRWIDQRNGLCNRSVMLRHPMSTLQRGPLLLARTKRLGSDEESMFSQRTVWGKECEGSAVVVKHDHMLCACEVTLHTKDEDYTYLMCDYASAANRDLEDPHYFTVFV